MTDEKAGIKEEHEWLRRAYDELLERAYDEVFGDFNGEAECSECGQSYTVEADASFTCTCGGQSGKLFPNLFFHPLCDHGDIEILGILILVSVGPFVGRFVE